MARPSHLASALRPVVRVARFTEYAWMDRHGATLDSRMEGEAP